MNREEAEKIYYSVIPNGCYDIRSNFIDAIGNYEFGYVGEIAKDLNKIMDEKFILGVEIGIMIGLNLVYNFRKDKADAEVT